MSSRERQDRDGDVNRDRDRDRDGDRDLDRNHPLRAALRALAADDETRGASAEVEARLLAEVRSIAWTRRHGPTRAVQTGVAQAGQVQTRGVQTRVTWVAAAALFAMIAAGLWQIGIGPGDTGRLASDARRSGGTGTAAGVPAGSAATSGMVATGFLPLTYSRVPVMDGQIVRLEVPRAALASFGLASIEQLDRGSAGTVLADVLVGQDGLARAVRFVRPAASRER